MWRKAGLWHIPVIYGGIRWKISPLGHKNSKNKLKEYPQKLGVSHHKDDHVDAKAQGGRLLDLALVLPEEGWGYSSRKNRTYEYCRRLYCCML